MNGAKTHETPELAAAEGEARAHVVRRPSSRYARPSVARTMGTARFQVCGQLSVDLDGRRLDTELSGARARLCLAYLLLHRDRAVLRPELVSAIWGDELPERPEAALATVISRLRATLGGERIEGRRELRLVLPPGARVDVEEAVEGVARAEHELERGDAVGASRSATAALEIARGELLAGSEADWLDGHRRALADVRARALECVATAALRVGGPALAEAERASRELVQLSPYRESAQRLLMRVLAARGDTAEALTVYERLRGLLREELGTVPSRETAELHRRLLCAEDDSATEEPGRLSGTVTVLAAALPPPAPGSDWPAGAPVTGMQLLRDAARTAQGSTLDDGEEALLVAFDSSLAALDCATLMQQFVAHHAGVNADDALAVRCGVAVGELGSGGDPARAAVADDARRLCSAAELGQILVSDVVRALAAGGGHDVARVDREEGVVRDVGPVHEVRWATSPAGAMDTDAAGSEISLLDASAVEELERILAVSGVDDARLGRRYSVVFAYPGQGVGDLHLELSGCTTQVCAIVEEAATLARHGIHVVGLSTEPSVTPPGCSELGFPVGVVPDDALGDVLPAVERADGRYAARTSFVVFPDCTGVRITDVRDVIAHVRRSLDIAMERRLAAYRDAALAHVSRGSRVRASAAVPELLVPGADSVAIPRVEVKVDLVAKIAAPGVIAAEAGHVERVNRLLEDAGQEGLFPQVVSVCTDEDPGWYLMEALGPVSLTDVLFADAERTVLDDRRTPLVSQAVERIARLYELTFRAEVPATARYHYLDRFRVLPARDDARTTYASLFADGALEDLLDRRIELDGGFICRSYREQLEFLEANVDRLAVPITTCVHGDFHLPNMLLDERDGRVVLIDPRVVWDGHDVGERGFCDPLYDVGTLLQSVQLAAPLLRAVADGESERLVAVDDDGGTTPLRVREELLKLRDNPVAEWCLDCCERALPAHVLGPDWRARAHVLAANAGLGWLRYRRSVATASSWMAIFATVLHHLESGRRLIEGDEGRVAA